MLPADGDNISIFGGLLLGLSDMNATERNGTERIWTELNWTPRFERESERRGESSGAFSRTLAMNGTQLCFLFVCVLFFLECSTGGGLWCILKTGLDDLWCRSSPILYMYCMRTAQVSRIERALFTDRRDDTRSTNAMHIGTLLIDRRGGDRQRGVLEIWIARCVRNANDQLSLIPSCPELCIIDSTRPVPMIICCSRCRRRLCPDRWTQNVQDRLRTIVSGCTVHSMTRI